MKILLISGSQGVGKSTLAAQFIENEDTAVWLTPSGINYSALKLGSPDKGIIGDANNPAVVVVDGIASAKDVKAVKVLLGKELMFRPPYHKEPVPYKIKTLILVCQMENPALPALSKLVHLYSLNNND